MRTAMHAASQLPGRGPTDVDVAPVPKSDDDDDDDSPRKNVASYSPTFQPREFYLECSSDILCYQGPLIFNAHT